MKKIKRSLCAFLMTMILALNIASVANAAEIMPLWENTQTVQTVLSFNDSGQAVCSVYISGKSGTSKITGTMTLKDLTADTTAGSWPFSSTSSICSVTKYANATTGHTYELSVTAYVYNSAGVAEHVSGSVTKTK